MPKQTKRKPQAKKRKRSVKVPDLPVAAAGAVKGGGTKTTTTTTTTNQQEYLKVTMTDALITSL